MTTAIAPTRLYRVQLQDEMPAIGSGNRWVFVREGRKWAYILCPYTATTVKLPLPHWRRIKREEWERLVFVRAQLRGRLERLERTPTAFERSALGEV